MIDGGSSATPVRVDTAPPLEYEPGVQPPPIVIEKPAAPTTTAPTPDADSNTTPAGVAPPPAAAARSRARRVTTTVRWAERSRRVRVVGRVLLPEGITRADRCSGRGGRAIARRTRALDEAAGSALR